MSRRNLFTDKFQNKSNEELRDIVNNESNFQKDAVLAAIWLLEERGDFSEADEVTKHSLEAESEQKQAEELKEQKYATFWERSIAAGIDGVVLTPIGYLLNYLTGSEIGTIVVIGNLLNNFFPYLYSIFFHARYGQTVGKMVMDLKVVDHKTEEAIGLTQAFKRDSVPVALILLLSLYLSIAVGSLDSFEIIANPSAIATLIFVGILSIIWALLEVISMLFNEKFRAIHDLIAGTVVVHSD